MRLTMGSLVRALGPILLATALSGCATAVDSPSTSAPQAHHTTPFAANRPQPTDDDKSADYSGAFFVPALWFTVGRTETIDRIVLHTTEGGLDATLAWFQDPLNPHHTSTHYLVGSRDGAITQMVRDADTAHHVKRHNSRSLGIQLEAYAADAEWFTDAQYRSAAALVRHLAIKYGLTLDRAHIVGHAEMESPQLDMGPNWDWDYFMILVKSGETCGAGFSTYCEGDVLVECIEGNLLRTDCLQAQRFCLPHWRDGSVCGTEIIPAPPSLDTGEPPPAPDDPCAGVSYLGRCEGTVALWCDGMRVRQLDCAQHRTVCRYISEESGYYCAPVDDDGPGGADPSPIPPPSACETMPPEGRCEGNLALWCHQNQLYQQDCAAQGTRCRFINDVIGNFCDETDAPKMQSPGMRSPGMRSFGMRSFGMRPFGSLNSAQRLEHAPVRGQDP